MLGVSDLVVLRCVRPYGPLGAGAYILKQKTGLDGVVVEDRHGREFWAPAASFVPLTDEEDPDWQDAVAAWTERWMRTDFFDM